MDYENMSKIKFFKVNIVYILYVLAFVILIGSYFIFVQFNKTSMDIKQANLKSNINYIDNISTNLAHYLSEDITTSLYDKLKNDEHLREEIEEDLEILVTKRYKYVYIVDKAKRDHNFRFLLDGSNDEDRSEFEEPYTPTQIDKWDYVYKTKKPIYFQHKEIKSLWLTYLKPIVINNKVDAIIVIDFSLDDHQYIVSSVKSLKRSFVFVILFSFFVFIVILILEQAVASDTMCIASVWTFSNLLRSVSCVSAQIQSTYSNVGLVEDI